MKSLKVSKRNLNSSLAKEIKKAYVIKSTVMSCIAEKVMPQKLQAAQQTQGKKIRLVDTAELC